VSWVNITKRKGVIYDEECYIQTINKFVIRNRLGLRLEEGE